MLADAADVRGPLSERSSLHHQGMRGWQEPDSGLQPGAVLGWRTCDLPHYRRMAGILQDRCVPAHVRTPIVVNTFHR